MHNDTLRLRALEPTDLDLLYAWENDAAVWTVSDTAAPYSRQVLWQYLENYTGDIYQSRQLRLMIELNDGTGVGTVDFFHYDPLNNRAELGLLIAPEHRGHGYGQMALQLARDYAAQHIGMRQLYVYIRTDNTTCLKLFQNFGFEQCGVLKSWVKRGRQYHDVALLQLLLS
ncbi:MAG: GNAT family N-acetyltransferase [Muribaculaceae bacterium]|nr:GNAT family N-acetyltransferase [Muribaculaceae bacterium]MBR6431437.1 GNAT family N-acetyltransferase [Muribaculaceae bacterium]